MDKPWLLHGWVEHTQHLLNSFRHWLKRDLIVRKEDSIQDAAALYHASVVVVSHGTQADPILNYGNALALELWEIEIPDLLRMPSRLTAEPMHRDERAMLLERTTRHGYVDDYRGIRISSTGRRFLIQQAIVWNVVNENAEMIGQAATFDSWHLLDDCSAPQ